MNDKQFEEYMKSHTLEETIDFVKSGDAPFWTIDLRTVKAKWEALHEAESEEEEAKTETEEKNEGQITLHFYAEDGKAYAEYTNGQESHKIELKDRDHAVRIAARAVTVGNEQRKPIILKHGFEVWGDNPFKPEFERLCLSAEAYSAVFSEVSKAKKIGLFEAQF